MIKRAALFLIFALPLFVNAAHADGPVIGWGQDNYGQVSPPASVSFGGPDTASAIAAGIYHSCAIQDGTDHVVCWGEEVQAAFSAPPVK